MKFSENVLFGYAITPAGPCCLGDDGGFSFEVFEDGSLIYKTYIVDRSDGTEKERKKYKVPAKAVSSIKKLLDESQTDIDSFDEHLDNGSCDGDFYYFNFKGKTVCVLNIEYCDEEEIKKNHPNHYKEYLPVIRQENRILLLFEKIMDILEKYGVPLD